MSLVDSTLAGKLRLRYARRRRLVGVALARVAEPLSHAYSTLAKCAGEALFSTDVIPRRAMLLLLLGLISSRRDSRQLFFLFHVIFVLFLIFLETHLWVGTRHTVLSPG